MLLIDPLLDVPSYPLREIESDSGRRVCHAYKHPRLTLERLWELVGSFAGVSRVQAPGLAADSGSSELVMRHDCWTAFVMDECGHVVT